MYNDIRYSKMVHVRRMNIYMYIMYIYMIAPKAHPLNLRITSDENLFLLGSGLNRDDVL